MRDSSHRHHRFGFFVLALAFVCIWRAPGVFAQSSTPSGDQKTLVILGNFSDKPLACSREFVQSVMFDPVSSVAALYRDNSLGKITFLGDVVGPYTLNIALAEGRMAFDVAAEAGDRVILHYVPMSAIRKLVKDYLMICDSYQNAIRNASPSQI